MLGERYKVSEIKLLTLCATVKYTANISSLTPTLTIVLREKVARLSISFDPSANETPKAQPDAPKAVHQLALR